jgi:hypothetical protein
VIQSPSVLAILVQEAQEELFVIPMKKEEKEEREEPLNLLSLLYPSLPRDPR